MGLMVIVFVFDARASRLVLLMLLLARGVRIPCSGEWWDGYASVRLRCVFKLCIICQDNNSVLRWHLLETGCTVVCIKRH